MIVLRLFHKTDPARGVETRTLAEGELSIGRDRSADWALPDPTKTLSRRHCVLVLEGGVVSLRDDSTNGVFRLDGSRFPAGTPTPLRPGETVALGDFLILVEAAATAATAAPPVALPALGEASLAGKLLDAFCGGAQIDSSVLSGEDPTEVMRRIGGIYRQMVLGLGALMNERTRAKAGYGLEWTTVQALDNNPFRWAPPQRIVIDLLQTRQDGFLNGEGAVRASFDDLHDHQQRLAAGSRAAVDQVLADLAPDTVAHALKGQSFLNKKKADALWVEYVAAHDRAREGMGTAAFREAYARGRSEPDPAPGEADEAQPAGPAPA